MCERRREAFRVGFDRSVKIEFRGAHVTSDAGLLAFRELDEVRSIPLNLHCACCGTMPGGTGYAFSMVHSCVFSYKLGV